MESGDEIGRGRGGTYHESTTVDCQECVVHISSSFTTEQQNWTDDFLGFTRSTYSPGQYIHPLLPMRITRDALNIDGQDTGADERK